MIKLKTKISFALVDLKVLQGFLCLVASSVSKYVTLNPNPVYGQEFMNLRAGRMHDDDGLTIHDLLTLPEEQRRVLNWIQRQTSSSLRAVAAFLGQTEEQTHGFLNELQQRGFVRQVASGNEIFYEVRLKSMRQQHPRHDSESILDVLFDDSTR